MGIGITFFKVAFLHFKFAGDEKLLKPESNLNFFRIRFARVTSFPDFLASSDYFTSRRAMWSTWYEYMIQDFFLFLAMIREFLFLYAAFAMMSWINFRELAGWQNFTRRCFSISLVRLKIQRWRILQESCLTSAHHQPSRENLLEKFSENKLHFTSQPFVTANCCCLDQMNKKSFFPIFRPEKFATAQSPMKNRPCRLSVKKDHPVGVQ